MARLTRRPGPARATIAVAFGAALAVATLALAGCSSGSSTTKQPPVTVTTASAASIASYTRAVCGGLRAERSLADTLHALAPALQGDSESRSILKAQLIADLGAADKAATLGAQFVAHADVHGRDDFRRHRDAVVAALHTAAADYQRWGTLAKAFPIFDRDNWEVVLISTEGGAIRNGAWIAWQAVAGAVAAGPVGVAIVAAAPREPICHTVLA